MKKLLLVFILLTQPSLVPLSASQLSPADQALKDRLYGMIADIDDLPIKYSDWESILKENSANTKPITTVNIDQSSQEYWNQQKSQEYFDAISNFWREPFPESICCFSKATNCHFRALSIAIINGARPQNLNDFEQILHNMHDYFCIAAPIGGSIADNLEMPNHIFECSKIVKSLLLPNWEDPTERKYSESDKMISDFLTHAIFQTKSEDEKD